MGVCNEHIGCLGTRDFCNYWSELTGASEMAASLSVLAAADKELRGADALIMETRA